MRPKPLSTDASQPPSQPPSNHTYEVNFYSAGSSVIVRCFSAGAAAREQCWQQGQGRAAAVKAVAL